MRPKSSVPANDDESWYECVAIGKNSVASMLKEMCQETGIEEKINHSLRATGTMSMFQANVSEQVIQKKLDINLCKLYNVLKEIQQNSKGK